MATVVVSQTTGFNMKDLWVQDSSSSLNENYESQTSSTQTGLQKDESYSEFTFDAGIYKYNYVGNWDIHAENSVTPAEGTASSSGFYDQIVLETGLAAAVSVIGLTPLNVDFGTITGLPVINLANPLPPVFAGSAFSGNAAYDNLHLGATPNLPQIAFAGDDDMTGNIGDDWLVGFRGDDDLDGRAGADRLVGGRGADLFKGRGGDDTLDGGSGDDRMRGGTENDLLRADSGNDTLVGGLGKDRLSGGVGNDNFDFNFIEESTTTASDHIFAFVHGEDHIDLSDIDADVSTAAIDGFTLIDGQRFSGQAGELRVVQQGHHTIIRGDVNGDKVADFGIVINHLVGLDATDFL